MPRSPRSRPLSGWSVPGASRKNRPAPEPLPLYRHLHIAVVVPAFDEAPRIGATLGGLPPWVDRVVVVDDGSADGTGAVARAAGGERTTVVRTDRNRGVGHAVATGYAEALRGGADVVVVVGADGQMDPADMGDVVAPVAAGRVGYAKGNRLTRRADVRAFPTVRLLGTRVLSVLTRVATGLRVADSQCGYTAASRAALERIDLGTLWTGYGYPNDLLVRFARAGVAVADVPVRAVYGAGTTKMRVPRVVLPILRILLRGVIARCRESVRFRSIPGTAPQPVGVGPIAAADGPARGGAARFEPWIESASSGRSVPLVHELGGAGGAVCPEAVSA